MPFLLAALVSLLLPSLVEAAPPRPVRLGLCVACHGESGRSRTPGTPHLAGQDETYLRNALQAYRSGARRSQPMGSVASSLPARDIAGLARWYARQPAGVGR